MYRSTAFRQTLRASQRRTAVRLQTTQAGSGARNVDHSHALAGLAGGVAVLGGLYAYYHISGTAKVVQTARGAVEQAQQAKDKIVGSSPSPKDAVNLLKGVVKSYAGAVPGSGQLVDSTFDQLEFLADKYGDDVNRIAKKTYSDVQAAISDSKNTGEAIMKSLQDASQRLSELAGDKGQQLLDQALQKQPELRKAVGDAHKEFQQLVETQSVVCPDSFLSSSCLLNESLSGPKARDIALATYSSAAAIVSKGGFNSETVDKLKQLLSEKSNQLKKLAEDSGADVSGKFDTLRKEASSQFDDSVLKKIPGFEEVSQIINNNDLKSLRDAASKHGDEANKILHQTYDEIKEVLRRRAGEAQKVAENASKDAKQ